MKITITLTALGLLALMALPAIAEEAPTGSGTATESPAALSISGADIGQWFIADRSILDDLQNLNPAASDLRVYSAPDGSTLQPGEAFQLIYGGLSRTYVTVLRYHPGGAVSIITRDEYYDKMDSRRWTMDDHADANAEGTEVFLSIASKQPLTDDYLDRIAVAPNKIQLTDGIMGSSYTWFWVKDQTGLQVEEGRDLGTGPGRQGRPFGGGKRNPSATSGSRGPVDESLRNPYEHLGGITPTQGNPYYNPNLYNGGAYLYNPFVRLYGNLPYYAPFPYGNPGYYGGGGGNLYRPVVDYGNAFYAPNTYFYVIPRGRGVRTNFLDLIFNAGLDENGLILRGGGDFIEGQINLDFGGGGVHPTFNLRLRGVRDQYGRFFNEAPIIVIIDGTPHVPLIDPNTGDMIVPVPELGVTPGLGNRMRIQPRNNGDRHVLIGEIDVQ